MWLCAQRLWWEVALPIVRPMIGAYTLLSFMGAWNSFLWPQVVLQSPGKYTLPIGLTNMLAQPGYITPYGVLMAGTFLSILPVAILFFVLGVGDFFSRYRLRFVSAPIATASTAPRPTPT